MCFLPVQPQPCLSFLLVEPVLTQGCKTRIYNLPPHLSISQCYSVQLTEISLPNSFSSRSLTLFHACTGFKVTSKGSVGLAVTKFQTLTSYHLYKGCTSACVILWRDWMQFCSLEKIELIFRNAAALLFLCGTGNSKKSIFKISFFLLCPSYLFNEFLILSSQK